MTIHDHLALFTDRLVGRLTAPSDDPPAVRDEATRIAELLAATSRVVGPADRVASSSVARFLPDVLDAGRNGPETALLAAVASIADALTFVFEYPPDARWPDLGQSVGFANIVGEGAPVTADGISVGLTLMAPGVYYPRHRHPAVELYLVLSGTAVWVADGHATTRPPGSLILHPTLVDHAMRTGAEPLLALYTWSGDIQSPSVFTE